MIGHKWYEHGFVVASFSVKSDEIIGLDLLKSLGTRIDLITEELQVDDQRIKFKSNPPTRRVNEQWTRIGWTEPQSRSVKDRRILVRRTERMSRYVY
jgi:hypothetical protein